MELKELTEKMVDILNISNPQEMPERLFEVVNQNEVSVYEQFCDLVEDLETDWLQMIFQYYQADRKEKKQDYTPKSLAMLLGKLAGDADIITDLCAGSGALTIQKWAMKHEQKFELYEFDERVIPFLLFNMAVRNIECIVFHEDVLQQEIFHVFKISKGEKFATVKEITR